MRQALSRARRPRPRTAGVLVMLVLHLGLLLGVWALGRWPARQVRPAPAQAPLIVRLLGLRPATPDMANISRSRARAPTPTAATPARAVPATAPQAITLPAPPDSRTAVTQSITQPDVVAAVPAAPAGASAPASAPLDLKLRAGPGATWRTPAQAALNDPRANTPRATLESRIAAAAGPGAWVEERIDETRVRFRRGSDCFELHRTRNAVLSPWNQAISPTPQMATPCN